MSGMPYGVRFSTVRSADQVEGWLDANCGASWTLRLTDLVELPDGTIRKNLIIYFHDIQDKERFRRQFLYH